ncbi:MAG: PQQ-binding-like beta-propeller repeat protein [Pirellulaceae bacterium]|nr:PQQ-binding-like beta-propeller repeat protein [Pirellulaceae bacterium]
MRCTGVATGVMTFVVIVASQLGNLAEAQERSLGSVSHGATAQERLLMEQIDQLAATGQYAEAVSNLQRLTDNSQGRLIEVGSPAQAATLSVQVHAPITRWAIWRLHAWQQRAAEQLKTAGRNDQQLAIGALQTAQADHDAPALQKLVHRYALAPASTTARLFLCDLYLDRGWTTAARHALDAPGLSLRVPLPKPSPNDSPVISPDASPGGSPEMVGDGLPWPSIWSYLRESDQRDKMLDESWQRIIGETSEGTDRLRLELLRRILTIAAFDATAKEFADTCQWSTKLGERLPPDLQMQLKDINASAQQWFEQRRRRTEATGSVSWSTFAGDAARSGSNQHSFKIGSWPTWSRQLERITGGTDVNPASKPPVAESSLGVLPYHPVVHSDQVYVNELTRVMAYDLRTGKGWPVKESSLPVFDSDLTAANYLPFGYRIMGAPRGTLTIQDDILWARMGPPVTAWLNRTPTGDGRSLSYIVALDLRRDGSMRPGFPVRLEIDDFPSTEFEGTPTVLGSQVFVCLATRDNVNLRRSLICIDRDTGDIRWRSPILASGMVSGCEQASLVSHQLVTASGGRVYINTNLGSIACLDQDTGEIVWLARYRRSLPTVDEPYPKPDRYRYRDLTPCMVVGTQLICAPQDCPELFSLDVTSGELLWSTDAHRVDDATQLLGVHRESIIVSGDRIYWLDRQSGRMIAAFPGGGVGDVSSALPAPRGYGRGVVGGDQVYWSTQNEIFVFDADQQGIARQGAPSIKQRFRLDTRGAEGGNLTLFRDGVIIAGASRLFVFRN